MGSWIRTAERSSPSAPGRSGIADVDDAAGSDASSHHWGAYDLIVEYDSDAIADVSGRKIREALSTRSVELEGHLRLVGLRIPLSSSALQHVSGHERHFFGDDEAAVCPLPETDRLRFPMERNVPRESPLYLGQSEVGLGHVNVLRRDQISPLDVSRTE
jgi:hypothetical protein